MIILLVRCCLVSTQELGDRWQVTYFHSPLTRQSHISYTLKPVLTPQHSIRPVHNPMLEKIDTAAAISMVKTMYLVDIKKLTDCFLNLTKNARMNIIKDANRIELMDHQIQDKIEYRSWDSPGFTLSFFIWETCFISLVKDQSLCSPTTQFSQVWQGSSENTVFWNKHDRYFPKPPMVVFLF